jgi:HTH-type transcriptional regulator/antitoxin HigA
MNKVIKNETEYAEVLTEVERLVERDPALGTPDADRLELLAVLIENYEAKRFPRRAMDPIDAIRFRMEQQGLSQRELIPFIGSRSRVSEVLSRTRPLTLSMIRALHRNLNIPAESLLGEHSTEVLDATDVEWDKFPVSEIVARGWVEGVDKSDRYEAEDVMRRFCKPIGMKFAIPALYKRTKVRAGRSVDRHALGAWTLRIAIRANSKPLSGRYKRGVVTDRFMRELAQLSWSTRGPLLAEEFLGRHGIALIVEPHLSRTRLDGAAILITGDRPVIGLTIRYDRIDNFWHSLMHELAHVGLHLKIPGQGFYDDLDTADEDAAEKEADELARDALVPRDAWERSPARNLPSPEAAVHLAEQLRIHPAIVAGRMRYESKNYRILPNLLGGGEVQKLFVDVVWPQRGGQHV